MLKHRKLRLLEHVQRMEEERIPKNFVTGYLRWQGVKVEEPRLRWLDDAVEDLKVVGVKR